MAKQIQAALLLIITLQCLIQQGRSKDYCKIYRIYDDEKTVGCSVSSDLQAFSKTIIPECNFS